MMKLLRKRHLQVWTLLAFFIPAGIISGYFVIPKDAGNNLLQEDKTAALPVVINQIEKKEYSVYLRNSEDKRNFQLQWINNKESTLPSALIYKISNGEKELIGRVVTRGSYYFPLKEDSTATYHFILYDIIHQKTIDTIKFK